MVSHERKVVAAANVLPLDNLRHFHIRKRHAFVALFEEFTSLLCLKSADF